VAAKAPNNRHPSGYRPRPTATEVPKMKPENIELRVKDRYALDLRYPWKLLILCSIDLRLNLVSDFALRGFGDF
jgi:hypothetical protein